MYWSLLAATRFLLAAIVSIAHLTLFLEVPQPILFFAKFSGLIAVLGFLLISGYSIAASYNKEEKGFYVRRIIRIVPLYILCVSLSAILPVVLGSPITVAGTQFETPNLSTFINNLLFLQGFSSHPIKTNPIVWTLSLEIFLYIIAPLLAKTKTLFVLLLSILSALSFIFYPILALPYYSQLLYGLNIIFLSWPWLLGFWYFHNQAKPWSIFLVFGIGVCCIGLNGRYLQLLWPLTWMGICLVVGYGNLFPKRGPLKLLNLAGDVSYPLYLLHFPIYILAYKLKLPNIGILYFSLVLVVSVLLDVCFDKPIKQVIRKRLQRNDRQ